MAIWRSAHAQHQLRVQDPDFPEHEFGNLAGQLQVVGCMLSCAKNMHLDAAKILHEKKGNRACSIIYDIKSVYRVLIICKVDAFQIPFLRQL